jgi:hypothetical protein
MRNYYIKVRVEYVDYVRVVRDNLYIRLEFDKPHTSLYEPLQLCIRDFYNNNEGCDVVDVQVIESAVYD